ncbi:MAG TPA: Gfo/Idh/MocA family oxidoreductase [Gemmatimonadaceae bacterium]|nr:Gfo/Idh/MocA family oxidoreductase [Gemmatimonadaceae bacterium]
MSTPPLPVRAAIVGAGLMGRWHAHAIRHAGASVAVVIDPLPERAKRLASRVRGGTAAASELAAALREHRPDVVHVCSPVETHEPVAMASLDAGAHVLIEKPLAVDAPATRRLHERAAEQGVLLCPVHQFLFQRGVLESIRRLPELGPLRQLDIVACSAGADGQSDAVREQVARDILPHGLALARRILGRAVAEASWSVAGSAGELRALASLGATTIVLSVSMRARPTENSLIIRCDGGTVRANLYHGFATIERGAPSRIDKALRPFAESSLILGAAAANVAWRALSAEPAYPGLRALVRTFYRAVAQGAPSPIGVDESIDVAHMRDVISAERDRSPH